MLQPFNSEMWINKNFDNADFHDKRLSKRLHKIASCMAARPEGSIPQQMGAWKDIKGCYGFLRNEKVTHKRIQDPHRKHVREFAGNQKTTLFAQDTSEANYSGLEETEGLGPIGNHKNRGLLFHSCLAVEPHETNPKIIGLANQIVWKRTENSLQKSLSRHERNKRKNKESDVWLKTIKAVGRPPEGCTWVSIGDRANDIFEFFEGIQKLGWSAVVRAAHNRCIVVDEEETYFKEHIRSLPSKGTSTIEIRREGDSKAQVIPLNITWDKITINPPQRLGKKTSSVTISVIRCWNEEKEIDWMLYSSIEVNNLAEALEKIEWYSNRWIIEEYHKCLKTGCRIESHQPESAKSLQNLLGVLSIIAILMLQLRNTARDNSEMAANTLVDKNALEIISKRYNLKSDVSIGAFWRCVANLGGFIGRKSDGQPGWQTLWKGWLRLLDMMSGHVCLQQS